jgi:hypothetical protein
MSIRDVVITRVARTIAGKTSNILYFKLCGGQTNTGIVVIKVLLSVCRYLWFAEVRCLGVIHHRSHPIIRSVIRQAIGIRPPPPSIISTPWSRFSDNRLLTSRNVPRHNRTTVNHVVAYAVASLRDIGNWVQWHEHTASLNSPMGRHRLRLCCPSIICKYYET